MTPIKGFPGYFITKNGTVWSTRKSGPTEARAKVHELKPWRRKAKGKHYLHVSLCKDGKPIKKPIHRLMAETFLEKPPNAQCVRHLDDNPLNNYLSNLAWGTYSDNLRDAITNGVHHPPQAPKGEKQHAAKLTPMEVVSMRQRRRLGSTLKELAIMYKVSLSNVQAICTCRTWKHLS